MVYRKIISVRPGSGAREIVPASAEPRHNGLTAAGAAIGSIPTNLLAAEGYMARLDSKWFFLTPRFGPGRSAYRRGYRHRGGGYCRHQARVPVKHRNGDSLPRGLGFACLSPQS